MKTRIPQVKLIYTIKDVSFDERVVIRTSKESYEAFLAFWDISTIEHHECFKILLLNRANRVIGIADISEGGTTGTVVDIKIIMQYALLSNAGSIILGHNHPSGNLQPSESDNIITRDINQAAQYFKISVLDHIILSEEGYFSYSDEGKI